MERARRYVWIVAGAAAAATAFELGRLVAARVTLAGWYHGTVLAMSLVTCLLVAAAAVGVSFRREWGFVTAVVGALALVGFGLSALAGGAKVGIVHLVLGVVMLFALGKSMPAFRAATTPASSRGSV